MAHQLKFDFDRPFHSGGTMHAYRKFHEIVLTHLIRDLGQLRNTGLDSIGKSELCTALKDTFEQIINILRSASSDSKLRAEADYFQWCYDEYSKWNDGARTPEERDRIVLRLKRKRKNGSKRRAERQIELSRLVDEVALSSMYQTLNEFVDPASETFMNTAGGFRDYFKRIRRN